MDTNVGDSALNLILEVFKDSLVDSVQTHQGTEALWKELEEARLVMRPEELPDAAFSYPFMFELTQQGRKLVIDRLDIKPQRSVPSELFFAFHEAKKNANYNRQMQELTGVDHDSQGFPMDPYEALEQFLEQGLKEIRDLRSHQHKWNDDDLCSVCGADGRA